MKKLFFATVIFFVIGVLFARFTQSSNANPQYINTYTKTIRDNRCLQFTVTFNADPSWNKNGNRYIYAGCDGQGDITAADIKKHPGWAPAPGCDGGLVKIHPGETGVLGRCSCFDIFGVTDKKGCLKIGQEATIPARIDGVRNRRNVVITKPLSNTNTCKVILTDNGKSKPVRISTNDLLSTGKISYFCGKNEDRFKAGVNISCKPPITPTFTSTPTPTGVCTTPAPVQGIKITCPNCTLAPTPTFTITPTETPTETPIPPTPTFTITPTSTPIPPTPTFTITPTPGGSL